MEIKDSIKDLFEDELREEILSVGKLKRVQEGDIVINVGQPIHFMPVVSEGTRETSFHDFSETICEPLQVPNLALTDRNLSISTQDFQLIHSIIFE